jgi:homoserine dehydrogenase
MKLPRINARRMFFLVGVVVLGLGQLGSTLYQRYLECDNRAREHLLAEGVYRAKAESSEEVATNLREVAKLAREMAGSSASDFERTKWQEMARKEDEKADSLDEKAVQWMARADELAALAEQFARLGWRPWLSGPY